MAYLLHGSKLSASQIVASIFQHDAEKGKSLVHEICDQLLVPSKHTSRRTDAIEWLKVFFSEGDSFDNFCTKVRNMDSSSLCGCVWTANFVAYRCRTCATSPCMSLCAACFEKGVHEGHDYNIFRSEAGGACDCGDSSVLQASGFCSHHGPNRIPPQPQPPRFLAAGKVLLDRMFLMFIHVLRMFSEDSTDGGNISFPTEVKQFFEFVLDLVKLGSPVRKHVSQLLLNESLYSDIMQCKRYKCLSDSNSQILSFHKKSMDLFHDAVKATDKPIMVEEIKDTGQFDRSYQYKTYLDEIMFWIVRYEFPEPVILIVLNLLPDTEMKREFSKCFTRHYSRIAISLLRSSNVDQLCNRVVHISVQLFSNNDLACMLATEENLLEVFLLSMHNIIRPFLEDSQTSSRDYHQCISSNSHHLKTNVYWPIVSDFVNVLSHQRIARMFLESANLINCWFQQLMAFCGMDLCNRQLRSHIEYDREPTMAMHAFYSERESCATTLWCLIDTLQDPTTSHMTLIVIRTLMDTITELFDALGFEEMQTLPYDQCSFHYPLHRYLAQLISNGIKKQGLTIRELNISEDEAMKLMSHPLQVLTTMYEVTCNMWVRNGIHVSTQALAYKQYFFCKFFIDSDLYLLQLCASILPPDTFIASVFERCRVIDCLNLPRTAVAPTLPYKSSSAPHEEKIPKMLEAAFKLILSIFSVKTPIDLKDEDLIQAEVIVLLTSQSCTYSMLSDHIPHEFHSGSKALLITDLLTKLLKDFATKKEGDTMEQTTYLPNDAAWKLYDPVFMEHRTLYKRDMQHAHTSYLKHLKENDKLEKHVTEADIWPPYQPVHTLPAQYESLANLLHCKTLFAFIFTILNKQDEVTDITLSIILHLLDASFRVTPFPPHGADFPENKRSRKEDVWYAPFQALYDLNDPFVNFVKLIPVSDDKHPLDQSASQATSPSQSQKMTKKSILTLLLRLYDKCSGKSASFCLDENKLNSSFTLPAVPPMRANVISNLLHLAAARSAEVKQTIQVICGTTAPPSAMVTDVDGRPLDMDEQSRKLQAREARKRLMKQMAMKQQQFMQQAQMTLVVSEQPSDSQLQSDFSESMVEEDNLARDFGLKVMPTYECVICGNSETELEATNEQGNSNPSERLMSLICLVQPSTVLGHRTDSVRKTAPYKPGSYHPKVLSCRGHVVNRHNLMKLQSHHTKFEQQFREQNLFASAVGIHVSSCGHHVHLACQRDYMDSVRRDESSQLNYDMHRGFMCPLCRQTSNLVLPCNIRPKQFNISETQNYRVLISKIWLETLNDIESISDSATFSALIAQQSSNSLNLVAFASAIVRTNLENHLLQLGNTLLLKEVGPSLSPRLSLISRKLPVGNFFILMYRMNKVNGSKETRERNSAHMRTVVDRLSGRIPGESSDILLLLEDPITLLLQMMLESPLTQAHFHTNVELLFNLVYIQALVHVSCKFSSEERRAWKNNVSTSMGGIPFSSDNLECLLGFVIRFLPHQLFEIPKESFEQLIGLQGMGYSTTVFSPQSVMEHVERLVLHFLQVASLLHHHLFDEGHLPIKTNSKNEFGVLATYLGLSDESPNSIDVMKCLKWDKPTSMVRQWCEESSDFIRSHSKSARSLLTSHRTWLAPHLLDLPRHYSTLFQLFRESKCDKCGSMPDDPAVCLVCGAFICYKKTCKPEPHEDDVLFSSTGNSRVETQLKAACRHAQRCGAGTSIFLLINSAVVVLIRGSRACIWGTVYLDAHGEEDRGWKRGKPLFLKPERLRLLEQQWIQHVFDSACKGWTVHGNSL
ncbi:E3 ubiquitin-protein ligase UBR3-like [Clavelina lepadiformis]|uniref:E3 ubiquitin-protein ligase UBR3-like n=1 Tax=Clavelina lepadiformis TaxID=159417 RepID=UPI0040418B46